MDIVEKVIKGGRFIKLLINWKKEKKVSPEVAAQRMSVCKNCPRFSQIWGFPQCTICGCDLDLKTKLVYDTVAADQKEFKKAECPNQLW